MSQNESGNSAARTWKRIPDGIRVRLRENAEEGVIDGGMRPKVQSAVRAIEAGVHRVHMLDGRQPHSLLLEIFTDKGIGTEIVK